MISDPTDPADLDPADLDAIPAGWRDDAEEIRAHLCGLRGGGAFLSSADAWQLVRWFEAGVTVAQVLFALERAAEARRKKRGRTPLSLVAANRHLGKPLGEPLGKPLGEPLGDVAVARDLCPSAVDALERELRAIPDGADAPRCALAAARRFFDAVWAALGDDGQSELRDAARAELGDLLHLVDEVVGLALVEETARDRLRQRYPALSAARLAGLAPAAAVTPDG